MNRLLYPRLEAAQLLSISLRKIDMLIAHNEIKTIRIGKRRLIAYTELEKFARRGT